MSRKCRHVIEAQEDFEMAFIIACAEAGLNLL